MEVEEEEGGPMRTREASQRGRLLLSGLLVAVLGLVGGCSARDETDASVDAAVPVPTQTAAQPSAEPAPSDDWVACGFTAEQLVVVEDYIEAWNEQDADAVMALISPTGEWEGSQGWGPGERDRIKCVHEAAFQVGLTLTPDFDACVGRFTPVWIPWGDYVDLCSAWCTLTVVFADDGLLHHTTVPEAATWVANDSNAEEAMDNCSPYVE
jgi:hypothetical protein